jgi:ABC-2 type transport system ATP-binding protein
MPNDSPEARLTDPAWTPLEGPAAREAPPAPAPARAIALEVHGISKTYDDTAAVKNLSFRVSAGEILGLVGANGAGKTTTLRSIAGILPLQSGSVQICGHDLVSEDLAAKRSLSWIPDDPQPFDSLTVDEHLRFTAALYGVADWEPRAESLLRTFELLEKRTALGGELSRGMRQKLAFCCAWLHKPGLVLMDEPLSGLDPRGIRSAKNAVKELSSAGSAVVLSSHLLELIEELADKLLILHRGEAVFAGTLDELRTTFRGGGGGTLEEIFLSITEPRPG